MVRFQPCCIPLLARKYDLDPAHEELAPLETATQKYSIQLGLGLGLFLFSLQPMSPCTWLCLGFVTSDTLLLRYRWKLVFTHLCSVMILPLVPYCMIV